MAEYQNILVGVDGSKQSRLAVTKAAAVAKRNDATLHLVSVINGEPAPNALMYGISDKGIYDQAIEKMKKILADLKAEVEKLGVEKVTTRVILGNAKVILTDTYPKENKIDLIVVGATGLNAIGRMIVGSTSAYIVRQAKCDVVVVRTDTENKPVDIKQMTYPEI